MSRVPTEASFLKDVASHEMAIHQDHGVFRNIRFQKPNTGHLYFDITTWPGFLCISGDMGCFVFTRLPDMFAFFRREPHEGKGKIHINLGYWHEKVVAECRNGGCKEFDPAEFKRIVNKIIYSGGWPKSVRDDVKDEVLACVEDGEYASKNAAYGFSARHDGKIYDFQDFWEYGDCKRYTYRFTWACYAIAWAVQQYDANKAIPVAEGAVA